MDEDPFEETFTSEVGFFGGSFTVVTGGAIDWGAACQLVLLAALQLSSDDYHDLRNQIFAEARVLLDLSDTMCNRASLGRWVASSGKPSDTLRIPSRAQFDLLRAAVSFDPEELSHKFGGIATAFESLHLPGPLGLFDHDGVAPIDERMYLYPLVRLASGETVIHSPGSIVRSLVHRSILHATDAGAAQVFHEALLAVMKATSATFLNRVGWQQQPAPSGLETSPAFSESFWRFDVDKIAHVIHVTDPLVNYEPGKPFDNIDFAAIEAEINARMKVVSEQKESGTTGGILHVVVSANLGRTASAGVRNSDLGENSEVIGLTIDDLDKITGLEDADSLDLWKFSRASSDFGVQTYIQCWSKLDEFSIYRDHGNGFYLSDGPPLQLLQLKVGTAAELRANERMRRDNHYSISPDGKQVLKLTRWDVSDMEPIYRPEIPDLSMWRLVEIAVPCWIVPASTESNGSGLNEDLCDAIAFWMWICSEQINETLREFVTSGLARLVIETRIEDQVIVEGDDALTELALDWLECVSDGATSTVKVTLRSNALAQFRGADNEAEKVLIVAVIQAISALVGVDPPSIDLSEVSKASNDRMKMLPVFGVEDDWTFALGPTGKPRLLSNSDVERVLNEIGEICRIHLGLTVGVVNPEERTKVLNDVVAELLARLKLLLADLRPEHLLEHFAGEQESLIFLEAREQLRAPTWAACFGDDSRAVQRSLENQRKISSTGPASRFLIELVTAIPPGGKSRLSVAVYDLLVAYAKEIVELGFLSDAIWNGLFSGEVTVLESGRLGVERGDAFHTVLNNFFKEHSSRLLQSARSAFAGHWSKNSESPEDDVIDDLNRAFEKEFGFTAREHALLSGELIEMCSSSGLRATCGVRAEVESALCVALDLDAEKVSRYMSTQSLSALESFPPEKDFYDVFPWRFSRDRSAARRPLLERPVNGDVYEIVWSPRSIIRSSRHLFDQIFSARLKAQSEEMKWFISEVRGRANDDFNRQVAQRYRDAGFKDVRENVEKIGAIRLRRANGEDIGDVDVLIVDPKQFVILAVEVKDFDFARTPIELRREIDKLLGDEGSAISHHIERLNFLRANSGLVVNELGYKSDQKWQIVGEVVTSVDLLGAKLPHANAHKGIAILSFRALIERAPSALIKRFQANPSTRTKKRKKRPRN
jgi:hypothetical protein